MEDEDLTPFGKFEGQEMITVPANYLLWLDSQRKKPNRNNRGVTYLITKHPEVLDYIDDNMDILEKEKAENEFEPYQPEDTDWSRNT